jgi:nucleoside-diphosphate-sugar epimerase
VETDVPAPVSPYAASKLAGEHVMLAWARSYGLSTMSLRYFKIFGPRQPADSPYSAVIAIFARKLLAGEAPTIFGDGTQSRDFTYVTNAVLANLLAGSSERPLAGEVVNVGAGKRVDLLTLHRLVAEACGAADIQPRHEPTRAGDVKHSLADLSLARELLGYEPVVGLERGLGETIDWYKSLYAGPARAGKL